jgi:hypothetical protein
LFPDDYGKDKQMKFYFFGGTFTYSAKTASNLNANNFDGVMYTYDATKGDMFSRVAKDINKNEKIKYLIAIRPYTISPQYLCAINDSINEIMKDRLQINFISGYIKDHEANVGGIVGEIKDDSSKIEKSNYMIEFLKVLNEMKENKNSLDFYVSTTNEYVFDAAKKYNNKIIVPYGTYSRKTWTGNNNIDLSGIEVMLALTPIIRETREELDGLTEYALRPAWKKGEKSHVVSDVGYFTYEEFDEFVKSLEDDGINSLLINAVPDKEHRVIIPFIKKYVDSKKGVNNV